MANMSDKYSAYSDVKPKEIKEDDKRTTLSLSLTAHDKKALKLMAMKQETTIAAIIHEWIQQHLEEELTNDRSYKSQCGKNRQK